MNVLAELIKGLLPLIFKALDFLIGMKLGKTQEKLEQAEQKLEQVEELNEKIIEAESISKNDYTGDRDDLYKRL